MPVLKGILQPDGAVVDVQMCWSAGQARQLRQAHRPVPPALDARALVDTGAEITCVDGALVHQLGLPLAQLALANVTTVLGSLAGLVAPRPSAYTWSWLNTKLKMAGLLPW